VTDDGLINLLSFHEDMRVISLMSVSILSFSYSHSIQVLCIISVK